MLFRALLILSCVFGAASDPCPTGNCANGRGKFTTTGMVSASSTTGTTSPPILDGTVMAQVMTSGTATSSTFASSTTTSLPVTSTTATSGGGLTTSGFTTTGSLFSTSTSGLSTTGNSSSPAPAPSPRPASFGDDDDDSGAGSGLLWGLFGALLLLWCCGMLCLVLLYCALACSLSPAGVAWPSLLAVPLVGKFAGRWLDEWQKKKSEKSEDVEMDEVPVEDESDLDDLDDDFE